MEVRKLLAFGAIYFIWGSTYLAIRIAIETIPPFRMMAIRSLAAGLVLYAAGRLTSGERLSPGEWRSAALLGALFFLVGHGALAWGELSVPSGVASVFVATIPVWATVFEVAKGRAELTFRILLGLALGLAGVTVLAEPGKLLPGGTIDPVGAAVVLLGALGWAVGTVSSRTAPSPKSSLLTSGANLLAGGTMLLLLSFLAEGGPAHPMSVRSLVALGYLIVLGSVVGFAAFVWLLRIAPAWKVSTYAFVNPAVAVLLGWIGGGEALTPRVVVATALMAAGVAVLVLERRGP
jgi:drug/metabolite transporter (DMT)-like permease